MIDIENMHGSCEISQTNGETAVLVGSAPVSTMRNYQQEVTAYTRGLGRLFCSLKGYGPCHNAKEIVERIGYDSERDVENPTGSVFCAQGSGFLVDWDEVKDYMHVDSYLQKEEKTVRQTASGGASYWEERQISQEEIDRILNKTFYANQGKKSMWKRRIAAAGRQYEPASERNYTPDAYTGMQKETKEEYLLVDGYNIIYAWSELKELADENMDSARMKLLDYSALSVDSTMTR